jgi:hypothetical protein
MTSITAVRGGPRGSWHRASRCGSADIGRERRRRPTADDMQVRPHPDDESWLKDLGFPKPEQP